jgi:hypothetical protein
MNAYTGWEVEWEGDGTKGMRGLGESGGGEGERRTHRKRERGKRIDGDQYVMFLR